MQAITIKWLTQTETKPYRWKVKAFSGELTMPQAAWFNATSEARQVAIADGVLCPKSYALWTFLLHKGWDGCWIICGDHKGDFVAVQYESSERRFGEKGHIHIKLG